MMVEYSSMVSVIKDHSKRWSYKVPLGFGLLTPTTKEPTTPTEQLHITTDQDAQQRATLKSSLIVHAQQILDLDQFNAVESPKGSVIVESVDIGDLFGVQSPSAPSQPLPLALSKRASTQELFSQKVPSDSMDMSESDLDYYIPKLLALLQTSQKDSPDLVQDLLELPPRSLKCVVEQLLKRREELPAMDKVIQSLIFHLSRADVCMSGEHFRVFVEAFYVPAVVSVKEQAPRYLVAFLGAFAEQHRELLHRQLVGAMFEREGFGAAQCELITQFLKYCSNSEVGDIFKEVLQLNTKTWDPEYLTLFQNIISLSPPIQIPTLSRFIKQLELNSSKHLSSPKYMNLLFNTVKKYRNQFNSTSINTIHSILLNSTGLLPQKIKSLLS